MNDSRRIATRKLYVIEPFSQKSDVETVLGVSL